MHCLVLLAIALPVLAQDRFAPDEALLRARILLHEPLQKVIGATYIQTIERSYYKRTLAHDARETCDSIVGQKIKGQAKLQLYAKDRLRLQGGVSASGEETYRWPDSSLALAAEVREQTAGPFHTGALGPIISGVFQNQAAEVTFKSERNMDGRPMYEYRFRVTKTASNYRLKQGEAFAYDGAILLDPETAALRRITVRSTELPVSTGACEATVDVEFSRSPDLPQVLLPISHRLHFILRNGDESENISVYRAHPPAQPVSLALFAVRSGLRYFAELRTPIDTATAAAGDVVELAAVADPENERPRPSNKKRPLPLKLPVGTPLQARIVGIERQFGKPNYFLIALAIETVFVNGESYYLPSIMVSSAPPQLWEAVRKAQGQTEWKVQWQMGWQVHNRFNDFGKLVFQSSKPDYTVPIGHVVSFLTK